MVQSGEGGRNDGGRGKEEEAMEVVREGGRNNNGNRKGRRNDGGGKGRVRKNKTVQKKGRGKKR